MKHKFYIFIFLLCFKFSSSQHLYDTTKYIKFYGKTLWSLYFNSSNSSIAVTQDYNKDTSINTSLNLTAESFQEIGISYVNRKVQALINLVNIPSTSSNRKPNSTYSNCLISFSDKNYLHETGYNWFNSYYDKNSKNFIKNFNDSTPFYNYNRLRTLNVFYRYVNFNNYKKFSYSAAYRGTAQQRKSAFTTLYYLGANYNRMESDTAIIPFYVRKSYDRLGDLNKFFSYNVSGGIGVSATVVMLKCFFINATGMMGPAIQLRQYSIYNKNGFNNKVNFFLTADLRFAIGVNLKRIMISNTTFINMKDYGIDKVNFRSTFVSNSFSLGYRFNTRNKRNL